MSEHLRIGQKVYGYCGGKFGRDSYDTKRVEAIGADWVVCRTEDGSLAFYGGDPEDLLDYTQPVCWECDGQSWANGKCQRCGADYPR